MASATNTLIKNIKPLATKSFDRYNKYTFRMTMEGRIDELIKFIYEMQASEQLLKIERMVLRAKERQHEVIKAVVTISKLSVL